MFSIYDLSASIGLKEVNNVENLHKKLDLSPRKLGTDFFGVLPKAESNLSLTELGDSGCACFDVEPLMIAPPLNSNPTTKI